MINLSADKRHLEIQVDGHIQDIPLFTLGQAVVHAGFADGVRAAGPGELEEPVL